jgi:4-diphosphocytidyl-2-C-methyl-D-erythritol kinase
VELSWYPAPAKLNLFLHILERRTEGEHAGYHELQTVFRLIDRSDRIGVAPRRDGKVLFDGPFGEDDLCVRAAKLIGKGCELALEKNIPVGGGLGGGSSDAATVLLVLNRIHGLRLSRAELMALGARLGADVPFFVYGHNAVGEGIGERLRALDLPPAWYLVITPQVSVSTRETFESALTLRSKGIKIPPFLSGQGRNDLEAAVVARHPDVAASLAWLRKHRPQARMTGSGACVFAEFETEAQARALLLALPGGMRGFVAKGLERHPLYDFLD